MGTLLVSEREIAKGVPKRRIVSREWIIFNDKNGRENPGRF
jgi:hypothetical protein